MTRRFRYVHLLIQLTVAAVTAIVVPRADAQFTYQELHSFEQGVANPQFRVVDGGDGYLYGTTPNGGRYGSGSIYRVQISTGTVTTIYSFNFTGGGPSNPHSDLINGGDGFLYGTAQSGGTIGQGTVYKVEIATGVVSILHSFNNNTSPREGANPYSGVTKGGDGFLYGTTISGGAFGNGTVYKVDPATGSLTVLTAFNPASGGAYYSYEAGVVDGGDGFVYGTTYYGGTNGAGTVYSVNQTTGTLSLLHSFTVSSISGGTYYPQPSDLIDGGNGYLYGTTYHGGTSVYYGSVYRVLKTGGGYQLLHSFDTSGPIGYYVAAGLTNGGDGFLYGTSFYGGTQSGGTLYRVSTSTNAVTAFYSFQYATAGQAHSGGVSLSGNTLYGASQTGGPYQSGVIYGVNKTTAAFTAIASLGTVPSSPQASAVDAGNGFVYGTTNLGGKGYGVIYKVAKSTGARTVLHEFANTGGVGSIGFPGHAGLIDGGDGFLYGATFQGGQIGAGALYKINTTTDALSVVRAFTHGVEGYYHDSPLTLSGGFLYGASTYGGANGYGAVYKVNKTTGATTVLHSFSQGTSGGYSPGSVTDGGNGYVYGTTQQGGTYNCGTLYKLHSSTPATLTILYHFNCVTGSIGYYPMAGVIDGGDGFLYGTTIYGGQYNNGTVFKFDKAAETLSTLHAFNSSHPQRQGYYPIAGVSLGRDGYLYGTTQVGGSYGYGTAYVLERTTGAYGTYFSFNRQAGEGYYPQAGLSQGVSPDDRFYGTTQQGGTNGGGIVFAFDTGIAGQAITLTSAPPASATYQNSFGVSATGGGSGNPVLIATSGVCSGGGSNSASITMTSGTGTCTITFDQAGGPNYNAAPTVTRTTTAVKRSAGISFSNTSHTFDGTPKSPTATSVSPSGLVISLSFTGTGYGPTSTPPTNAGSYTVTATINDVNYQGAAATTLTISKAAGSVSLSNLTQVYTGSPLTPTATTTPSGLAVTWSGAPRTAVGTSAVTATINDTNYQGSASGTFVIQRATATVTLSNLVRTYTGGNLFPTATTSPAGLSVLWSGAPQVNAGSYTVTATVNDSNYQGSATDTFVIAKATATVTLSGMTRTYLGIPLLPTASTSPAGLPIVFTGAPQTDAGSYPVTATVNHANYEGSVSGTFIINKATATVTLSNLTQTYSGSPLTPSAATSPSGMNVVWTGAPQTNAGSYPITATIDNPNYAGSASGTFVIAKAPASVILANLTQTYTGSALTPAALTVPEGLATTWTGAPQTNAGSYAVTATINDTNYQGSASGTFVIGKASATVTLGNLTQSYNGSALTPSATTSPEGLSITWMGAPRTNAGSYPVTATISDPNYQGSASGTFVIGKGSATITLAGLTQTYTGSTLTPAATTSPSGLSLVWTGAPQTGTGSYPVTATVNDSNYEGTASGTFVISKAHATVTLANLLQTFSGSPLSPTATTAPSGLNLVWTGTPRINAGSYPVTATIDDPNYEGSAAATFVIAKATASVALSNVTQTYTGSALTPTASTVPAGLAIAWTGAPQTNAGSHSVTATINDQNYEGSATGAFIIAKATATVTLSSLAQTYTGGSLSPTATTSPTGLAIVWTGTPQTNAGSYPVTATINDPNYEGSIGGTFVIGKASATVTLSNLTQAHTGSPLTPSATTSPAGLTIAWTGAPQTNAGSYAVTATVDNPNYQGQASGTFVIGKLTPSVSWGTPAPILYGTPLSATQLNATATLPGTFTYAPPAGTVLAGGTQTLTATFTPTDTVNYNGANVSTQIAVIHSWSNVLQPINVDDSSIFKLGSTVPVKFRLLDGSAPVTNLQALIFVAKLSNSVLGDEVEAVSTSAADAGNTFRYDSTAGQYIFNLNTKAMSQGTWQIRIDLRDGQTHTVLISLRK